MHAAINQRVANLRPFLRKVNGDLRAEQMLDGRRQTLDEQRHIHPARQPELGFCNPCYFWIVGLHVSSPSSASNGLTTACGRLSLDRGASKPAATQAASVTHQLMMIGTIKLSVPNAAANG